MDLGTIHRRLSEDFYRSVSSLCFDISLIQTNCDAYNPSNSKVVKSSKKLRDRLLEEVRIVTGYQYGALINLSKTTTTTTTSSSAASGRVNKREIRMRIETLSAVDLLQAEDTTISSLFRHDIAPWYSDIVLTPMDLTTLRNR